MAKEYLEIGPTPADEDCAQVGSPNYSDRARKECSQFIALIRRTVGIEPPGAKLVVRWNPHDFGDYLEVAVQYDPEIEEAVDYAFRVERDAPARWDV